jgi:hypothetical protein
MQTETTPEGNLFYYEDDGTPIGYTVFDAFGNPSNFFADGTSVDSASASPQAQSWMQEALSFFQGAGNLYQSIRLQEINTTRAQRGLTPISPYQITGQAAPGGGLSQTTLLIGAAALVGVLVLTRGR